MKRNTDWMLIVMAIVTSVAVLLVVLASAFLDVGGLGGFILDLLLSAIVQGVIALLMLGIVILLLMLVFKDYFRFFLSRWILTGFFFATAVMALAFIPRVFSRGLDVYDAITTLVLTALFTFIAPPVKRLVQQYLEGAPRLEMPVRSARSVRTSGPTTPAGFQPYSHVPPHDPNAEFQPIRRTPAGEPGDLSDLVDEEPYDESFYEDEEVASSYQPATSPAYPAYSEPQQSQIESELYSMTEVQLYNELYRRVGNDHLAAQRRLAEEYNVNPTASREDLLRSALARWEQSGPGAQAH